ncbi:MAG: amidohydrolase family protein [Lentisphaeria bacterium]|nr:amidohydrolase family protein [Lentisphaeria bacterium]
MKIIDVHSHIFPPAIAEKVIYELENFYGFQWNGTALLDDLLRNIRKTRISKCVIFSSATKPTQVTSINNFVYRLKEQYPELLLAFGTLHPEFENCRDEVTRIRKMGLCGLKFHPDFQQFCIDDPKMLKVYEAIGNELPVLFHIGDYRTPYSKPERLARILKLFPGMKLIAAHLGGYSEWDQAWKHLIGTDVFLDISSTIPILGIEETRKMVKAHGAEKILFASDYPAFSHTQAVQDVMDLGLSPEENEMIFHKNAEQLLGV